MKVELGNRAEQHGLIIMYSLKRNDKETLKELCDGNPFDLLIVWNNVTNNCQLLHVSVNQAVKKFILNKFKKSYAEKVRSWWNYGILPAYVNVSFKWSNLKPPYAKWILELSPPEVVEAEGTYR